MIGIGFQIQDDILGIVGEEKLIRKPTRSGIRRGKKTLMVIHAIANASGDDRSRLLGILGSRNASADEIGWTTKFLKEAGSIDYAGKIANKMISHAKEKLSALSPRSARRTLYELADFMVKREY